MNTTIVTAIPSPYQVELFDALQRKEDVTVTAVYMSAEEEGRNWALPKMEHQVLFVEDEQEVAADAVSVADVTVFSYYIKSTVRSWMWKRAQSGRPWVFWGERPGFTAEGMLGRWYRRIMLWPLYRSNTPIWGIGEWAVKKYQQEFGEARPYRNIPYHSNLERFRQASLAPDYGPGAHATRILYSGKLSKRKGVDLLAHAFRTIAPQYPHLQLDLAGDGPLRTRMETILEPIADRVTFHGFVEWDRLPAIYATADVLCAPSRYDGWALVVPEGLAAGLPVLATDRMGAALDLLRPGENGWRIEAESQKALRETLKRIANTSQEKLASMGRAGQQHVLEKHSLREGARRVAEGLEAAVEAF